MCNLLTVPITAYTSVPAKAPISVEGIPGNTISNVKGTDGKPVASASLLRISHNLAYFSLINLDSVVAQKAVTVSTPEDDPLNLELGEVYDALPFRHHYPVYIQVHYNNPERLVLEHLLDNLAETVLGRNNLELKKNVTIDLYDSDGDAHFRDRLGFFVSDRKQFHQITVSASEAAKVLKKDSAYKVEKFSPSAFQDLVEFDNTLSGQTRDDYLEAMTKKVQVFVIKPAKAVVVDEDEKKPLNLSGYAFVHGDRILSLVADSSEVAETLLAGVLEATKNKQFTLAGPLSHFRQLTDLPSTKSRSIYRRHTRAVPANVKWDRIFAMNVGINLF
ncbi:unnamed protein product [Bursaphelenchus okinawaensis]|uniref:DUF7596 domain-containing protein n=1 Tax=Bursaphelenchus okinawaensis TaxID=465554 RepID=A0A811KSR9_9BILA|nr:unnamed protein product [Bursaphelenchus okinawaensis]CAG9110739.1 unnamed protein product [Bursaphelenchus okinawaensis]